MSAQDRGGIRFPIVVSDDLSGFERFDKRLAETMGRWDQFRKSISELGSVSDSATGKLRPLADATERLAKATKEQAAASKVAAAATERESTAEERLEAILKRRAMRQEVVNLADEKGVDISTRIAQSKAIEEEALQQLADYTRKLEVAKKKLQFAEELGIDLSKKKAAATTVEEEAQKRLARIERQREVSARLKQLAEQKGIDLSNRKIAAFDAEAEALKRVTKVQNEAAVAAALLARGRDRQGKPLESLSSMLQPAMATLPTANLNPAGLLGTFERFSTSGPTFFMRLRSEVAQFGEEANKADNGLQQFLFTFRRLVGVFAVFQGVRIVFNGVVGALKEAVNYSARLEEATLGIASVLASVATVTDSMGVATTGTRELALAQQEARDQVAQLRIEALRTSATFEQLAETFQVAIGPGLQAGLTLDQVRKLTVRIAQSAAAIGLPQNQLPEEIRSLLTGTIQARTTRIATTLGITNEDIVKAKELGKLAEFLDVKFSSFASAAELSARNFNVLYANLKDGFSQLMGEAAIGLFSQIKGLLSDMLSGLTAVNAEGIQINPTALRIVTGVVSGVESAVGSIRRLFASVDAKALTQIADAIGNLLAGVGASISLVVPSVVKVAGSMATIFNLISSGVGAVRDLLFGANAFGEVMRSIVGFSIQWYTTFKLLTVLAPLLVKALKAVQFAAAQTALSLSATGSLGIGGLVSMLSPLTMIAGALAAAAVAAGLFASGSDKAGAAVEESRKRFENFSAAVQSVGAGVFAPSQSLKDVSEQVRTLTEDYAKAADSLRVAIEAGSATGVAVDALKALAAVTAKVRTETKAIEGDRRATAERTAGLEARNLEIQREISTLTTIDAKTMGLLLDRARELASVRERIANAEALVSVTTGLDRDKVEVELVALRERARVLAESGDTIRKNVGLADAGLVSSIKRGGEEEKILSIIASQLSIERDKKGLSEQLLEIDRRRAVLINTIAAAQFAAIRETAAKAQESLAFETRAAAAQVAAAKARERAATAFRGDTPAVAEFRARLASAQAEIAVQQQALDVANERAAKDLRLLELARGRVAALVSEAQGALALAGTDEDRLKLQTAIDEGKAAEAALVRQVAAASAASTNARLVSEARILEAVRAAYRASEQSAEQAIIEARARAASASVALAAEDRRAEGLRLQETLVGKLGAAERALYDARANLTGEDLRISAMQEQSRLRLADLQTELEIARAAEVAARARVSAAGDGFARQEAQAESEAAARAVLAIEQQIRTVSVAGARETAVERAKALNTLRASLLAIRETAVEETRAAREREAQSRAEIEADVSRQRLRAIEARDRFNVLEGTRSLLRLEGDILSTRQKYEALKAAQGREEARAAADVASARALEAQLKARLSVAQEPTTRLEAEQQLVSATATRVDLEERLAALRSANAQAIASELIAARELTRAALDGINSESSRATQESADSARRLETELAGVISILEARRSLSNIEERIAETRASVSSMEVELDIARRINAEEARRLDTLIDVAKAKLAASLTADPNAPGAANPAEIQNTINALEERRLALAKQQTAEMALQVTKLNEAKQQLEVLRMIEEEPVKMGAIVAFRDLYKEATDTFQFTLDFTKQAITGFASTVSGVLTDALDPNKDVDVKERFRQFFMGLLNSITTFLITLGLVTLAMNAIPGFGAALELVAAFNAGTGGVSKGLARGGKVPASALASPAHVAASGFALGGRPRGLDPRDTVPIWVQPGEFVLRKSAVDQYGARTIEAINRGLVDPAALGGAAVSSLPPVQGRGFAAGGRISEALAAAAPAETAPAMTVLPVLAVTEDVADTILREGEGAFRRALQRNRGTIASMSPQQQRGGR